MKKILIGLALIVSLSIAAPAADKEKRRERVSRSLESYLETLGEIELDNRQSTGSLWTESTAMSDGLSDLRARRQGDVVTIDVVEVTNAVSEASTDSSKESSLQGGIPSLFGLESRIAELPNLFGSNKSSDFQGDAATTRRSQFRTSLSAVIRKRFPNGYLLLEGNRQIVINNERQFLTVRGIVRSQDITPQNRILSTSIAELQIEVTGKGIVSKAQKPGILFRILSGIWPF